MRTGRTLTVFRKLETPPENLEQAPPPKIWSRHPPRKFRAGTPPPKFGAGTPPPENLEQAPPPNLEQAPPPCGQTHACENITLAKTSFRPVIINGP